MTKKILIETCSDCPYMQWRSNNTVRPFCTSLYMEIPEDEYEVKIHEDCELDDYYSERG